MKKLILFMLLLETHFVCLPASVLAFSKTAPAFQAQKILNETTEILRWDPAQLNKPTLLVFWASWCVPCRYEVADILEVIEQKGNKLDVVGVSVDKDLAKARKFIADFHLPYGNFFDPEAQVANQFAVASTPALVLIDAKGEIQFQGNRLNKKFQKALALLVQ